MSEAPGSESSPARASTSSCCRAGRRSVSEPSTDFRQKIGGTLQQSRQFRLCPGDRYHRAPTLSRQPEQPLVTEHQRKPQQLEMQSPPSAPQTDPSWRGRKRTSKAELRESYELTTGFWRSSDTQMNVWDAYTDRWRRLGTDHTQVHAAGGCTNS